MVQVRLSAVTKRFGETVAVKEISFATAEEEFLTLVGPSGCGKTTILRLIAGFEQPDGGDILFDGKSVLAVPPEDRRVGMVFQNYALFPHMNVWKNIAYGLKFRPGIDKNQRVCELLKLVDLAGLETRMPTEISAGQKQRVALARSLAPTPQLLLLDEPLSALDAQLRESLRTQIRRIQRELRLSTIYVTHDQEEALAISDRIAVMSLGNIEQTGTPQEVYEHPRSHFVASFVGRSNQLEGVVLAIEKECAQVQVGNLFFTITIRGATVNQGDRVTLFVREEHLRLDDSEANTIPARVAGLEYRGESAIVHLESSVGPLRALASEVANKLHLAEQIKASFSQGKPILFTRSVEEKREETDSTKIRVT
jgi:thiamine transport system ATP-binding protein